MYPYVMTDASRQKIKQADEAGNLYTRYSEPVGYTTSVAPLANRTQYLLPEVIRNKWVKLIQDKNPVPLYGKWLLSADPNWFQYRSVLSCLMAYWETGDEYWLNLAKDTYCVMPDISSGQSVGHLGEIGFVANWLLIEPYLNQEQTNEWQRRLVALGDYTLANHRVGDWDQCVLYLAFWKLLDKYLILPHQPYSTSEIARPVVEWVNKFMDSRDYEGGPRDASMGYEVGTAKLIFIAAAIYGKDIYPWFEDWASKYTEWLPYTISSDYVDAVTWGDQQDGDGSAKNWFHIVPLAYIAVGLGYNTIPLISFARRLSKYPPTIGSPGTMYPTGTDAHSLICDPELMVNIIEEYPLETGTHIAKGIGTIVYRNKDSYVQTHFNRSIREDDSNVETEDHHYCGGFANFAWRYKGQRIIAQPGGYGIGGNEFFNLNSPCMKNDGWLWSRKPYEYTGDEIGFTIRGKMYGPSVRYQHALGEYFWPEVNEFGDCSIDSKVIFDSISNKLSVEDVWTSPGNTFDARSVDLPVFQRSQFALGEIAKIDSGLQWKVGNITVTCMYKMYDDNNQEIQPNIVLEPVKLAHTMNFYQVFIQSPKDLYNGKLILDFNLQESTVPVPPPAELPEAVDLTIVNNTDIGFSTSDGWIRYGGQGVGNEVDYIAMGDGNAWAKWHAKVKTGKYRVSTTWSVYSNRATNAPYKVFIDDVLKVEKIVNQKVEPDSLQEKGINWFDLAEVEVTTNSIIKVELNNNADGYVIADAVRIEKVGDIVVEPPTPVEIEIKVCLRTLADGSQELYFKIPKQN